MMKKGVIAGIALVGILGLYTLKASADRKVSEPARTKGLRLPTLHAAFNVAPLRWVDGDVEMGRWITSSLVMRKPSITVVVVATWCGYSDAFMRKLRTDASIRAAIDAVLVYENDAEIALDLSVDAGKLSAAQAQRYKQELAVAGQFLYNPDFFETPPAKPTSLRDLTATVTPAPAYVIRKGTFQDRLDSVPTALRCDARGCKVVALPGGQP